MLEQQINFINEDKKVFLPLNSVLCDTIENTIEDNKHTNQAVTAKSKMS